MESRWEGILASIFNGFWWILGAKLGPSWEGKSSQDRPRQAKTGQDKGSEGKGRERKRKGRDWKGKVWKSVPVDLCRSGGEGFARLLGGYCHGKHIHASVSDLDEKNSLKIKEDGPQSKWITSKYRPYVCQRP